MSNYSNRMQTFESYRNQIAKNALKIQKLKADQITLLQLNKKIKTLRINEVVLPQKLQFDHHYCFEFPKVKNEIRKIQELNKQILVNEIDQFNERANEVLAKNEVELYKSAHNHYLKTEIRNEPIRADLNQKCAQAVNLKKEFKTYKKQLEPNLKRLENALLKANQFLGVKNIGEENEKIMHLFYSSKGKIFSKSFWIWMTIMGILLATTFFVSLILVL